jgi:hypothetical protein
VALTNCGKRDPYERVALFRLVQGVATLFPISLFPGLPNRTSARFIKTYAGKIGRKSNDGPNRAVR